MSQRTAQFDSRGRRTIASTTAIGSTHFCQIHSPGSPKQRRTQDPLGLPSPLLLTHNPFCLPHVRNICEAQRVGSEKPALPAQVGDEMAIASYRREDLSCLSYLILSSLTNISISLRRLVPYENKGQKVEWGSGGHKYPGKGIQVVQVTHFSPYVQG